MTQVGTVYGEALYALALEEGLTGQILEELTILAQSFRREPGFIRLLSAPALSRQDRCRILDDSFRGNIHAYVLNFLKLLTEKGYMRHFPDCCAAYEERYNRDNGILPVTATTAVALSPSQFERLASKLSQATCRQVKLLSRIDPACLGGIRLDYDGKRLDATVQCRLDAIRSALKGTVL